MWAQRDPFHITATLQNVLPTFSLAKVVRPCQSWGMRKLYTQLDVDIPQIRLASILPGRWSEEISCTLSVVSLDDKPEYEALSYTWGDPSDKVPVILNGVTYLATRNLRSALRRLRSSRETRQVWIDALCINQVDKAEKSRQVSMIKEIYSGTKEVQIYLGESKVSETISELEQSTWTDPPRTYWYGDERDLQMINDLFDGQNIAEQRSSDGNQSTKLRQTVAGAYTILAVLAGGRCLKPCLSSQPSSIVWSEAGSVLEHLASSPWWKRVWVVEEAILSRTATTIYGEVIAPLDLIERGGSLIEVHFSRCCKDFCRRLPAELQGNLLALGIHTTVLERIRHVYQSFNDQQAVQLQDYLQMTRTREAYDLRDKVYSLLGLIKDCPGPLPIVPDYSLSVSQLYILTAVQFIKHSNSLEILATHERKKAESEIPTWAPDWSSHGNNERTDAWIHTRTRHFDAGPWQDNVATLCHDRILAIKGIEIDAVTIVTTALSQDASLADRLDEFARLAQYDESSQMIYTSGTTIKDAFWRTMLNDTITPEPNLYMRASREQEALFDLWWLTLKNGSAQLANFRQQLQDLETFTEMVAGFDMIRRSFWEENDNRVFFTTQNGYMGFGPPDMKAGDLVYVLLGSKVPFVLRPGHPLRVEGGEGSSCNGGYYSLVGYCYVHGIMDGEAVHRSEHIRQINLV